MTEQPPNHNPADAPVDPLFTHPASPFLRTEAPAPVAYGPRPGQTPGAPIYSTWVAYRTQIEFGLTALAYLMVLEGTATVLQANPDADWRYYVALLPILPAGLVVWLFVRSLARLDEVQRRIQVQAFGLALGATGLLAFGYGFLEGSGLPHLNLIYVVPVMVVFWAIGTAAFKWLQR
jgi:hypothetical protein